MQCFTAICEEDQSNIGLRTAYDSPWARHCGRKKFVTPRRQRILKNIVLQNRGLSHITKKFREARCDVSE
nr:unnamed protein product [Callosobruchus analis]